MAIIMKQAFGSDEKKSEPQTLAEAQSMLSGVFSKR